MLASLFTWTTRHLALATMLCAGLSPAAMATTAHGASSTGVNGLWTTATGDYTIFLQDSGSGSTFALEVPATFNAIRVWMGTGSSTALNLQNLANPADLLVTGISGSTMSGTRTLSGMQQAYSANLALAWVATDYAGVWQKSTAANTYMVFCVLNSGGARLGVQIDVTINADRTYAYDIFTGTFNGTLFNGLSLAGSGLNSRLEFNGNALSGTYTSLGRPPQVTPFTATHIVKLAP